MLTAAVLCASAAAASPAMAARSWTPVQPLTQDGSSSRPIEAAVTSTDEVVALWSQDTPSGHSALRAAAKPSGGGAIGPVQDLAQTAIADLATDGQGNALVAWKEYATGTVKVATRPAGGAFGAPDTIGDAAGEPLVAANDHGDAAVLYLDWTSPAGYQLWTSFRPAGGAWNVPQPVSGALPADSLPYYPAVALSSDGTALFAWDQRPAVDGGQTTVQAATRTPAGTITPPQPLSAADAHGDYPRLAADAHGHAIFSWLELPLAGGDQRAKAALRSDATGVIGPAVDIGGPVAGDLRDFRLAVGSGGHAVVSWTGPGQPDDSWLKASRGDLGTGIFSRAGSFGEIAKEHPQFVVGPHGEEVLLFTAGSNEVHAMHGLPGGAFGPEVTIGCPNLGSFDAPAGIDSGGVASLVWAPTTGAFRAPQLSQDQETAEWGPHDCNGKMPKYTVSPERPDPGQQFTIDGSNAARSGAVSDQWAWDLDENGTFEVDTGATPTVTHSYATGGDHSAFMKVASTYPEGSGATETVYQVVVHVTGDRVVQPGGDPAPTEDPLPSPPPVLLDAITVAPRASESIKAVVRRGLLVRVRSTRGGKASLRLLLNGRRAAVVGSRAVTLKANRRASVRVHLRSKAGRKLARMKRVRLAVQARVGKGPAATATVTLKGARAR